MVCNFLYLLTLYWIDTLLLVYTTLPQDNLNKVNSSAIQYEKEGFDGLLSMENAHDPFLPLAISSVVTKKIFLTTGIAIAFPRSPMVVANACWDLQEASGGRFVLGIGPQVKAHNERRFSVRWTSPVSRMKEYVNSLRAIWNCWIKGEKLKFEGEHYNFSLMIPRFVPEYSGQPPIPVTISAVGPKMLKLAGEVADGVKLHPFCSVKYLKKIVLPLLNKGIVRNSKNRENFEIMGGGFVATGRNEEEVARSCDEVRQRIGFYGSTPNYWPVLEEHDLLDLGHELNVLAREKKWDEMTKRIDDDIIRLFAAVGTYENIAKEVRTHFGNLIDSIYVGMLPTGDQNIDSDLIQDMQKIETIFKGFKRA